MCGMLAGGATVPGLDLIDTLPLVWQTVMKSELWQDGRALAEGAETPDTTAKHAISSAVLPRPVICPSPLGLPEVRSVIRGTPIR
jgi:hypothetical protein